MMNDEDKKRIARHEGLCGMCKHFEGQVCKPTESTNSWLTWFDGENAECYRYPPVFVGGNLDDRVEEDYGDYASSNWQYPKVHAFSKGCGEYVRASWIPNPDQGNKNSG